MKRNQSARRLVNKDINTPLVKNRDPTLFDKRKLTEVADRMKSAETDELGAVQNKLKSINKDIILKNYSVPSSP